jgi:hypothetical protein
LIIKSTQINLWMILIVQLACCPSQVRPFLLARSLRIVSICGRNDCIHRWDPNSCLFNRRLEEIFWTVTRCMSSQHVSFHLCRFQTWMRTLEEGADTITWLGLQPNAKLQSGEFYFDRPESGRQTSSRLRDEVCT